MVRKTSFTPKIHLGPGTFQSRQNGQRDIKITRNVGKISVLTPYINYAYIHCLKKTKDRTILISPASFHILTRKLFTNQFSYEYFIKAFSQKT